MGWADAHITALREDVGLGLSFAECAADINLRFQTNYTRNATVGKAHRIGLVAIEKPKPVEAAPKPRHRPGRYKPPTISTTTVKPAQIIPAQPRCDEVTPRNLTLLEVAEIDGCRWATNDAWPHLFCGNERIEGKPYCPFHSRKSAGQGTSSERRAGS